MRATTPPTHQVSDPADAWTLIDGEAYFRISNYHRMPAFLMNIASDTDIWMFVTSGGGLTAGRVDPDGSLFPYETVDKLHDAHHHTGPITVLRVQRPGAAGVLWQPFTAPLADDSRIERHLYKNVVGNRLIFEEIDPDLQLAFRARWSACEEFGLVRTATLTNLSTRPVAVVALDGLRNILPHGVPLALQQQASCLVDAYKKSEYDADTRLGIFALTAKIIDRAEPAEELRANAVWCAGLERFEVSLSIDALAAFRRGEVLPHHNVLAGQRGNYLIVAPLELEARASACWHLVADVGRSHAQVAALRRRLLAPVNLGHTIEHHLRQATANLRRIVGSADGLQLGGDTRASAHHFANVLFNTMRGGVFQHNDTLPRADLVDFIRTRNLSVAERHAARLAALPESLSAAALVAIARSTADADFERLAYEYLPLWFGRRHGDPSRPWNRFTLRVRNADGSRALRYEGNWRDIFQNWEALSLSFPGFLPHLLAKFVNASTLDGFNPYRLTRAGIDWEIPHPHDPWSTIGYWGDHQIVYLLRFLEALPRFAPGTLQDLLTRPIFCYADVPYRIAPYDQIVAQPRTTIAYDREAALRIDSRVRASGTDGKLVHNHRGSILHVSFLEKLLVPALAKLANFVPEAGIWMNTQRPEWNDANNALAGHGVSVVTLCALRRYLKFLETNLASLPETAVPISQEVVAWLRRVHAVLRQERPLLDTPECGDAERKRLLDALGQSFSDYREQVYACGLSGKEPLEVAAVVALCRDALAFCDHAIRANRRADGLYHAYNVLAITPDGSAARITRLAEMLEGQVAVLGSGLVEPPEAVRLLDRLFASRLYREDQRSFMLYPERHVPGFLERNVVPESSVDAVPLLRRLLDTGDTSILELDVSGVYRFHADFHNADDLTAALDRLAQQPSWTERVRQDRDAVLDVYERVFAHHAFTGRSGTMYGYEGIGSVYWHMVAKLLLTVQEITVQARRDAQPAAVTDALVQAYFRIRAGLGFEKTVAEYGAFPTDPYSHTPLHGGAQQPGMTGQVKEEILTRFGELGVQVEGGTVRFRPLLLRRREFRRDPGTYHYFDVAGRERTLEVPAGGLAFSVCQVPVIYRLGALETGLRVTAHDGTSVTVAGDQLDAERSQALWARTGSLAKIEVNIPEHLLCRF